MKTARLLPSGRVDFAQLVKLFGDYGQHDGPDQRQLALELFSLLGMLTVHSFFNDELSWHCPLLYFAILGYAEFVRVQGKTAPALALPERRSWEPTTVS